MCRDTSVSWLKTCKDEALLYLPLQHCKSCDQTLSCYGLFTTWLIPLMSSHSCLVDVKDPSAGYYPVLNHDNSQLMVSYWWIQWSEFTVWTRVSCQAVSPTNSLGTRLYHHMLKWLAFTGILKFQCKQFVIWSCLNCAKMKHGKKRCTHTYLYVYKATWCVNLWLLTFHNQPFFLQGYHPNVHRLNLLAINHHVRDHQIIYL